MILILSEEKDLSTVHIIEWLLYWGIPFVRINQEDRISIKRISINVQRKSEIILVKNGKEEISINQIKAYWYRRGFFFDEAIKCKPAQNDLIAQEKVLSYMEEEQKKCFEYLNFVLDGLPRIGTFDTRRVNKLKILHLAWQFGLEIPETLISSEKTDYLSAFPDSGTINKSISEGLTIYWGEGNNMEVFTTYTEDISENMIPDKFFPSLFQSKVEKEADIRIFYLFGACYTMAIRSQDSLKTATDFRRYDDVKPNRCFPFKLPSDIEKKLYLLMDSLNMETGSIDMILTKDGKYIFLEINPVGQFNMVSVPCNYQLEKQLAHKLTTLTS